MVLKMKPKPTEEDRAEMLCDSIEALYAIDPKPADGSVDQMIEMFEWQLDMLSAQSPAFNLYADEVG